MKVLQKLSNRFISYCRLNKPYWQLPIQGTERLSFKLSTPGAHEEGHIVDCSEETGHPMHVYKLTDKKQLNEGTRHIFYTFVVESFFVI